MSASSMTDFVRTLFKQTDDYRSLTQRIIRDRYMQHADVDHLDDDQRTLLREIVQIMVAEMVQNEESQISNEKSEDKSAKNSKQPKHTKALANKKQSEANTEEEEEDRPQKKRKLEYSDDSASESERTSVKKKESKNKIVDSSSENDGDSSTEAKGGNVIGVKKQPRTTTKKISQKEDSDMSASEPEDSNSESEKGKSPKTKVVSRQLMKNQTKPKVVERKKKVPELSGVQSSRNKDLKPKKLKSTTAKKSKLSEFSEPSSDSETDAESDGSESLSKHQMKAEKKQAKAETRIVSRKRKLSSSSDVEPASNKVMKPESHKMILDSDESSDGESLQQFKNKLSSANKDDEDDNGVATQDDLGKSRKKTDSSKNSVKTFNKVKSSSIDDSDSEDEEKLSNIKKKSQKSASDSDSESSSTIQTLKKSIKPQEKQKGKKPTQGKKPSKTPTQVDDKDERVKKLERIARACGVLPFAKNYKLAFEHCQNNDERSAKLKQMLRDAGMTGTISMKSAEALKLKKEAAELLSNNVIIPEGRRRRVPNPFSGNSGNRIDRESSSSPPTPPARENFSRLKGIVDSEEDSD